MCNRVGLPNCFVVNSVGKRGGLAMLWREDINLESFNFSHFHMITKIRVKVLGQEWILTSFHGQPDTSKRPKSWGLLDKLDQGLKSG